MTRQIGRPWTRPRLGRRLLVAAVSAGLMLSATAPAGAAVEPGRGGAAQLAQLHSAQGTRSTVTSGEFLPMGITDTSMMGAGYGSAGPASQDGAGMMDGDGFGHGGTNWGLVAAVVVGVLALVAVCIGLTRTRRRPS